ncbi:hypothetical protein COOONC_13891 [Cooperia oncophora]
MATGNVLENCVRNFGNRILSRWSDDDSGSGNALDDNKNGVDGVNVTNDATKFSVSVDVSPFKPDELRVHINGRELIIEGNQEKQSDNGYIQRWRSLINVTLLQSCAHA